MSKTELDSGKDKKKKKIKTDGGIVEEEEEGQIDFIIQDGDNLYPIKIKETESPTASMASIFDVLDKDVDKKRSTGVIIVLIQKNYIWETI